MPPSKPELRCQTTLQGYEINYAGDLSAAECVDLETGQTAKSFTAGKENKSSKNDALTKAVAWVKGNQGKSAKRTYKDKLDKDSEGDNGNA